MPKRGSFSRLRRRGWSFRGHMPTFGSTMSLGSSASYVMHHSPCRWPNRRNPGIKIHDSRVIRLFEVLRHGGSHVGGWTNTLSAAPHIPENHKPLRHACDVLAKCGCLLRQSERIVGHIVERLLLDFHADLFLVRQVRHVEPGLSQLLQL